MLVQANHGRRPRLRVERVPVGERIGAERVPLPAAGGDGAGSIIVVVATDAPLLPRPVRPPRLARRRSGSPARAGWASIRAGLRARFATGNRGLSAEKGERRQLHYEVTTTSHMDALFEAVIDATEEAILNALLAAETMTGRDGNTVHALPHELLLEALG